MSDNYPVDGELRRQAARIEAMEQAHAELAAKVEALRYQDDYSNSHWQDVTNGLANRIAALESTEVCDECVAAAGDMLLESPAPAPDPVCANCGHGQGHHMGRTEFCTVDIARGARCSCRNFVPTAERAPLDPVNMAVNELCDIVSSLAMGTVHMIGGNVAGKILERVEVIRAIFPDGRDGGR